MASASSSSALEGGSTSSSDVEISRMEAALVKLAVDSSVLQDRLQAQMSDFVERETQTVTERFLHSESARNAALKEGEAMTRRLQQQLQHVRELAKAEVANAEARAASRHSQAMAHEWQRREEAIRKQEADMLAQTVAMVRSRLEDALYQTVAAHERDVLFLGHAEAGLVQRDALIAQLASELESHRAMMAESAATHAHVGGVAHTPVVVAADESSVGPVGLSSLDLSVTPSCDTDRPSFTTGTGASTDRDALLPQWRLPRSTPTPPHPLPSPLLPSARAVSARAVSSGAVSVGEPSSATPFTGASMPAQASSVANTLTSGREVAEDESRCRAGTSDHLTAAAASEMSLVQEIIQLEHSLQAMSSKLSTRATTTTVLTSTIEQLRSQMQATAAAEERGQRLAVEGQLLRQQLHVMEGHMEGIEAARRRQQTQFDAVEGRLREELSERLAEQQHNGATAAAEREVDRLRQGVDALGERLQATCEWLDRAVADGAGSLAAVEMAERLAQDLHSHAAVRGAQISLTALQSRLAFTCDAWESEKAQMASAQSRLVEVAQESDKLAARTVLLHQRCSELEAQLQGCASALQQARTDAHRAASVAEHRAVQLREKSELLSRAHDELEARRQWAVSVCQSLSDTLRHSGVIACDAPMLVQPQGHAWPWPKVESTISQLTSHLGYYWALTRREWKEASAQASNAKERLADLERRLQRAGRASSSLRRPSSHLHHGNSTRHQGAL